MRRVLVLVAVFALFAAVFLASRLHPGAASQNPQPHGQPLATQPCHRSTHTPAHYQHVIWIWMENHSFDQIIGSGNAPYENQLAHACGLATDYQAITHPSLPNYLAATGGSTFGVTTDKRPTQPPINAPTIFSEVASSGRQWRTYYESMPSNCHPMHGHFARNPAAYFAGARRRCRQWDVPMGTTTHGHLASALDRNRLPAFSLMIPDLCHSTHNCPAANGDAWLSAWINRIVTSRPYRLGRTAIFLTWDEGKRDIGQHIPLIVVSPSTAPGTTVTARYDHYALLRTTADLLGVTPPGHAATAGSMRKGFGL